MKLIFMGSPEFSVPSLEHLLLNRYRVAAAFTQPDKPAGRGRALAAPPVKKVAIDWGIPVFQPVRLRDADAVAQIACLHPDLIIVAAYGQILPQSVLDIPIRGCINVHPSLLPKYRGASPIASAILSGDEFTGVSIMQMDAGMDTGPVLARAAVRIAPWDTTGSLTGRLSQVAAGLLQEVLVRWVRGEIEPQLQDEAAATCTRQFTKEDGEIDWRQPAADIWRQVRAFNPWPGCYTVWRGRQLRIIEALPLPGMEAGEAGSVVALAKGTAAFGVQTGKGTLGVLQVQLEGKRTMPAEEFLRGQREFTGAVLPG